MTLSQSTKTRSLPHSYAICTYSTAVSRLNELPTEHAASQRRAIAQWLEQHREHAMLLSCREADVPAGEFAFITERLIVRPLAARQIEQFVRNDIPAAVACVPLRRQTPIRRPSAPVN